MTLSTGSIRQVCIESFHLFWFLIIDHPPRKQMFVPIWPIAWPWWRPQQVRMVSAFFLTRFFPRFASWCWKGFLNGSMSSWSKFCLWFFVWLVSFKFDESMLIQNRGTITMKPGLLWRCVTWSGICLTPLCSMITISWRKKRMPAWI